ncbi:glycosyltransferase family 2 protein [Salegentibacter sp. UBA1130]|uniref:glycosyltransferase family 2 protein n=1 Tax=Salegentibacter sp. UBA1130 TaxID=1947451 RepID=UPI0025811A17|nr:glycosyltransferase family 2 protein [Salegentibacter sp. UBA1130]
MDNNELDSLCIIIVTYNSMPWIEKCLSSLKNFRVIVVDNNSSDNTVQFLKNQYPRIILLAQQENLGFGKANNIGIHEALKIGSTNFLLLNQDAYINPKAINSLFELQNKYPSFGVISPIHLDSSGNQLDKGFAEYVNFSNAPAFIRDLILKNQINDVYAVPFVNAACWMLSRRCLEMVGGFDPIFFLYGEDDNYCQRVLYHSFKIGVASNIYVIHDREQRGRKKEFFLSQEKFYKTKYANINIDNLHELETHKKRLRKSMSINLLKIKSKKFKIAKNELALLEKIESEIILSRNINKNPGLHYL